MRDYDKAIREVCLSQSEICAFLDFRDSLSDDFRVPCQAWDEGHDPPDYYLWADDRKVGVEVTTLGVCQGVFHANAKVDRVLQFLGQEVGTVEAPQNHVVTILFEPDSDSTIPDPRRNLGAFSALLDRLRRLQECPVRTTEKIRYDGGRFWLTARPGDPGRLHVQHQGFFSPRNRDDWLPDVNEAIKRKVRKYLSGRLYNPCWLLLNLKPYLPGEAEARQFLSAQVSVCDEAQVREVFERVYAVTRYISHVGQGPRCPVVWLV